MATTSEMYVSGEYLKKNPEWSVPRSAWKAAQILKMLKAHSLAPQTVCEVGCGAGEILRQMQLRLPSNVTFHGYDISPDAISLAQPRANERLSFTVADLTTLDFHADLLLAMDVLEHVEDCFAFVRALRGKATYKLFHIPLDISVSTILRDRLIYARQQVGHVHYFTRETALALLRDCGYNILADCHTPAWQVEGGPLGPIRHIGMSIAPHFTARLFSGCPLLVLAT